MSLWYLLQTDISHLLVQMIFLLFLLLLLYFYILFIDARLLDMIEHVANKIIVKLNSFPTELQQVWQKPNLVNKETIMTFYWMWWSKLPGIMFSPKTHQTEFLKCCCLEENKAYCTKRKDKLSFYFHKTFIQNGLWIYFKHPPVTSYKPHSASILSSRHEK